jgi:hypothetical protein
VNTASEPIPCQHHWASHHEPGHLLYWIRQCMLCHVADWDDLDAEIGALGADERERIRTDLVAGDPSKLEVLFRQIVDDEEAAECAGIVADLLTATRHD